MSQHASQDNRAERLEAILSTVDECYKVVGEGYSLIDMNPAGLELIEAASMDEVRGACVLDLLLPEHHEAFKEGFERALNGQRVTQVFEIEGLKGTRRWMEQTAVALPPDPGQDRPTQVAAFTRDISATRQAMQAMEEARDLAEKANRAKSQFLANMSHELRTPMTAIVGFTDLIAEYLETDTDKARSAIQTVQNNIQHLFSVINDVLDVSKIDAGQMTVERINVAPVQFAREVAASIRPIVEGKGLSFHVRQTSAVPDQIQSDPTRLKQILLNLLGNAIKFTEKGAITLEFGYDANSQQIHFTVTDTGIGLSSEQLERIKQFNAFTQADTSTTRKFGGSGLGLRISKSLAELMGGTIEITSTAGAGSQFTVRVDADSNENTRLIDPQHFAEDDLNNHTNQTREASTHDELALDGVKVLVAEDGPDNQRLIKHYLSKAGAIVTICADGEIAYKQISQQDRSDAPDLVLMDMQMPNLDGYDTTLRLREDGFDRPIIALTAHAMRGERQKCIDAGCNEYLTKPINRPLLIQTCKEFAQRKRSA